MIYTLTDLQYKVLRDSGGKNSEDGKPINICVPEPDPRGTQEELEDQTKQMKQLTDLVDLGLMKDISKLNEDGIKNFIEKFGFGLKFFMISDRGLAMFKRENLVVN